MNKYQEALSSIVFTLHLRVKPNTLGKCEDENLEILQELVDIYPEYLELKERATPKKPEDFGGFGYDECPVCHTIVIKNYCSHCGQRIDWSDDNE